MVLHVAVTGNESVGFAEEDFNDDFDPESYDKRMSKVFGDDYYGQEEEEKPVFPSDEGTYKYIIITGMSHDFRCCYDQFLACKIPYFYECFARSIFHFRGTIEVLYDNSSFSFAFSTICVVKSIGCSITFTTAI